MTRKPLAVGAALLSVWAVTCLSSPAAGAVIPADSSRPVAVAVASALRAPGSGEAFIDAESLQEFTAPGGTLSEQLTALTGTGVAVGIDPRILASIRILGAEAPQEALDWLARLDEMPNDTFPLAWADSDLTVALQAGRENVLLPGSLDYAIDPDRFPEAQPEPTQPPTPTPSADPEAEVALPSSADLVEWDYTQPDLAWPVERAVTAEDLAKVAEAGYTAAILSSDNLSGRTGVVATTVGELSVARSDVDLSDYFRDAVYAFSATEWSAAMDRLSAGVVAISQSSAAAPALLLTIGRNPGIPARLGQTLAELGGWEWATPESLTSVLEAVPTANKLVDRQHGAERIETVERMLSAEEREVLFATIAQDPDALTSRRRLEILALLSAAWFSDPTGWSVATRDFLDASDEIRSSVRIADSSNINLPADRGELPVTVSNDLDQPVTVFIVVRPDSAILSVENPLVELTIEPNSQGTGRVPVQAVSNGEVRASVSLVNRTGGKVGVSTRVDINVQAGWETAGIVIFAALVVAVFALGIFRSIRGRRRAVSD